MNPPSPELRFLILAFMFLGLTLLEQLWPLRKATQARLPRILNNLLLAGSSALILKLAFYPLVLTVASMTAAENWGILARLDLPVQARMPLALLSLDWSLFLWHRLLHKVPFLWRFHNVHHTDLDLDTSTALRFHFGELTLSAVYRSAQIVILGISPLELIVFELAVTGFAQFHHSNLRLPANLDRLLKPIIMTPKMHGIHHSVVKLDIPQEQIVIGVPAYRDTRELTFLRSLLLPFRKQRAR
jgi:sterol desaturase/sphingolipid hydroxylase (fatty acid hydroxylase superfamily)